MGFKLGSETRGINMSFNRSNNDKGVARNIKIVRAPLKGGEYAEARNDGTIVIDPKVKPGSAFDKRIIKHEMKHMKDMEEGRAAYGDNWVMWDDKIYLRKTIDGKKYIDGPNGRHPEGSHEHPWEQEAVAAETE